MKTYHVYIMASASRVLYIGVTGDLLRRVREHKEMRVPGFTARYRVTELVYFEAFGDIRIAIAREKQIKGWLRVRKIALIVVLCGVPAVAVMLAGGEATLVRLKAAGVITPTTLAVTV